MKKIIALTALMLSVVSGSAFAAAVLESGAKLEVGAGETIYGASTDGATTGGVVLGRLSKGVHFSGNYTTSGYALATKHSGGTKMYGTAHDSTSMFSKDAAAVADPGAAGASAFATGWTAM